MRKGGILSGPGSHSPNAAVRINSLYSIEAAAWNNSVAIHPGNMAITGQPMQSIPTATS